MRRKYGMDKILRLRKTLAGGMTNQCGSRSQCQNESAENPKTQKSKTRAKIRKWEILLCLPL